MRIFADRLSAGLLIGVLLRINRFAAVSRMVLYIGAIAA